MKKKKYKTHSEWWEIGKLYTKTIIIEYCTKKNKKINNKYNQLIKDTNEEKIKPHPDYKKIEQNQIELKDRQLQNPRKHNEKQRKNYTK